MTAGVDLALTLVERDIVPRKARGSATCDVGFPPNPRADMTYALDVVLSYEPRGRRGHALAKSLRNILVRSPDPIWHSGSNIRERRIRRLHSAA
jgi:hypothetical protein